MPLVLSRALKLVAVTGLALAIFPSAQATTSVKIGVVYDAGGRGDRSFNDAAALGVDATRKSLKLDQFALREVVALSDDFDRENRIEFLIKAGYSIVICVGPNFATAVKYMAEKYPEAQLSIIGSKTVDSINVASMAFDNSEESFLAGAYAAGISKSAKVGFITSNTDLYKDSDGSNFTLGAKLINPKVKVYQKASTLNANIDAQSIISDGVDVIFSNWNHDAQVLNQVFSANRAKKNIKYIGKSPAQYFLSKNDSIAAIINDRFDYAVSDIIKASVAGNTLTDVINDKNGIYGKLYGLGNNGFDVILKNSNPAGKIALAKAKSALSNKGVNLIN